MVVTPTRSWSGIFCHFSIVISPGDAGSILIRGMIFTLWLKALNHHAIRFVSWLGDCEHPASMTSVGQSRKSPTSASVGPPAASPSPELPLFLE